MSNKIILKKSSVTGKIPQITDLEYGELAINYTDGRLYFKTSNNEIESLNANSVLTDNTLIGDGTENNELGINYATINITERNGSTFGVKLLPYLAVLLRYDDMQRDEVATVFDRNNTPIDVMVGQ